MRPGAWLIKAETAMTLAMTVAMAVSTSPSFAQATDPSVAADEAEEQTVVDESPIGSARAAAMGGAIITSADNLDAAVHNPAGIGGLDLKGRNPPWIRKLYFPWIGFAANQNSTQLQKEFKSEGGSGDSTVGKALIDAEAGKRQYGRVSAGVGMVFGRLLVFPYYDNQVAAVPVGGGSDMIDLHQRTTSGLLFGTSVQTDDERFSLGYSGYTASRSEVDGMFTYDEINSPELRKAATAERTTKSTALGHNAGFVWRMGKKAAPTFGVAMKNVGGTEFKSQDDTESVKLEQDLSAGFSLSPSVGKTGAFHFSLQADRLSDADVSMVKKYRVGLELSLGGRGSYALFALRAGYNDAGASAGTTLSLGLIGLDAAMQSVDIGAGNHKVVERRVTGSIYVNVAEF
jgi:hypothetical protein